MAPVAGALWMSPGSCCESAVGMPGALPLDRVGAPGSLLVGISGQTQLGGIVMCVCC